MSRRKLRENEVSIDAEGAQRIALEMRDLIFSQLTKFAWFRLLVASYAIGTAWSAGMDYFAPSVPTSELYPAQCQIPSQAYYDQFIFNLEVLAVSTFGLWFLQIIVQVIWLSPIGFWITKKLRCCPCCHSNKTKKNKNNNDDNNNNTYTVDIPLEIEDNEDKNTGCC
jgi:hypothetical protein